MPTDTLDQIRTWLIEIGFSAIGGISDGWLGFGLILLLIIALRIVQSVVNKLVKIGCTIIGIGIILLIVLSFVG